MSQVMENENLFYHPPSSFTQLLFITITSITEHLLAHYTAVSTKKRLIDTLLYNRLVTCRQLVTLFDD
jgi:hypothetical protein